MILTVFIRADDFILDVFRDCKDQTLCENIVFSIGSESLSQYALDTLNKGTTTDNTIELALLILERGGGGVCFSRGNGSLRICKSPNGDRNAGFN